MQPSPSPPRVIEVTTAAQAREVAAKRKANLEGRQLDKCPLCKAQHEYEKEWTQITPSVKVKMLSTLLTSCPRFLSQSPEQKLVTVTAQAACPLCTSWDHSKHKFGGRELPEPKCKVDVGGAECGGRHGKWFHSSSGTTGNLVTIPEAAGKISTPGLFEVYTAEFVAQDGRLVAGTIMIDSGSDTDYVRHDFAKELGANGEPHVCRIKVVDMDYRTVNTAKYSLKVVDVDGEHHVVDAQGLGSITTLPPDPDLSPLLQLLGDVPVQVLERPQGQVDVLIGLRNSKLHGKDVKEWGNLRLLRSRFGCGWAVRGTHELLQFPGKSVAPSYSMELHAVRNASAEIPPGSQVFHVVTSHGQAAEFHELAELGTTPKPACERCSGCKECTFRRKKLSREDQAVVSRVEASLQVDEVTGIMTGAYPWKPCVARMRSNRDQAVKIQTSIERHMLAAGTHTDFVEEVRKSITEGRVRRLTDDEIDRWHGPVHYVTIFAVVKAESVSTKTRVVSNSAMRNAVSRLSLNDCLWPGPNALADLLDCLIFWRGIEVAIVMDLKKAYQAIHTSPMELHLRRFVFRDSPDLEWETYGYTRANFGDLSAGLMLEVGKRRVADLGEDIDPQAAEQLRTKSYVDDSILGGSREDVESDARRSHRGWVHGDGREDTSERRHVDKIHGSHGLERSVRGSTAGRQVPWCRLQNRPGSTPLPVGPVLLPEQGEERGPGSRDSPARPTGGGSPTSGQVEVHAAAGSLYGNGPLRPPGPGRAGPRHWQAVVAEIVLAFTSVQLGRRSSSLGEGKVGKLVLCAVIIPRSYVPQDDSPGECCRITETRRLLRQLRGRRVCCALRGVEHERRRCNRENPYGQVQSSPSSGYDGAPRRDAVAYYPDHGCWW